MQVFWQGSTEAPADIQTVWTKLNDVQCLQTCIPGCCSLQRITPERFKLDVDVKFGPVGLTLAGAVVVADAVAGQRYRLIGEGHAGLMGGASGYCDIVLKSTPNGCLVRYGVTTNLEGPLAMFGGLVLPALARAMTRTFVERFCALVGAPSSQPTMRVPAGACPL